MRVLVFIVALLASRVVLADQLACSSQRDAERALALLPPSSLLIDFCSMCDDTPKLVRIESATVIRDCEYEVEVTGKVVATATQAMHEGYVAGARWTSTSAPYKEHLDLAYVYVQIAANQFQWLGGLLGLEAEVKTAEIKLPPEVQKGMRNIRLVTKPLLAK